MDLFGALMTFAVLWWLVFLMALPIGIESPPTPEKGHATGAPKKTYLVRKLLGTTLLTLLLTASISVYFTLGGHTWKTLLHANDFSWPAYTPSSVSPQ